MKRSPARLVVLIVVLPFLSVVASYRITFATPPVGAGQPPTTTPSTPQPETSTARTLMHLDRRLPEFTANRERLETVLSRLATIGQLELDTKWDDLAAIGTTRDTPIDVRFANVPVSKILQVIVQIDPAAELTKRATFEVLDSGRILITTGKVMYTKYTSERRYDVSDFLALGLRPLGVANVPIPASQVSELMHSYAKLVQDTVDSPSWTTNLCGPIKIDGMTLAIAQTDQNHRAIGRLLIELREQNRTPENVAPAAPELSVPALDLNATVGEMRFKGAALADVVDRLGDATKQGIFVNWRAPNAARVTKDLPVTIDLSGLPLDGALNRLLDRVGGPYVRLQYTIDENEITISTAADLAKNTSTRVYDVRAAIKEGPTRTKNVEAIIRRVQGIDPLYWKDYGGETGAIRELGGQLIVTATEEIQHQIAEELGVVIPPDEKWNPVAPPPPPYR